MTREKEIYKVTLVGSAGNAALLTFKFIAGVLGNSSAMVADAVHSLSDFVTDILVLVFVSISAKPQDRSHDYGHGKFETIASFLIGLALVAAATGIVVSGILKLLAFHSLLCLLLTDKRNTIAKSNLFYIIIETSGDTSIITFCRIQCGNQEFTFQWTDRKRLLFHFDIQINRCLFRKSLKTTNCSTSNSNKQIRENAFLSQIQTLCCKLRNGICWI